MADLANDNTAQPIPAAPVAATPTSSSTGGLSPWDDEIDLPPEQPIAKPVVGNISASAMPLPAKPAESSFAVPEDIETKVVSNEVSADQFDMKPLPQTSVPTELPTATPTAAVPPTSLSSSPAIAVDNPDSTIAPSEPAEKTTAFEYNSPGTTRTADQTFAQTSITPEVVPNRAIGTDIVPPKSAGGNLIDTTANAGPAALDDIDEDEEAEADKSSVVGAIAPVKKEALELPRSRREFIVPLIIIGLILAFTASIYLTETGLISIGVEKVYGAVGLQSFWGGLPKDPERALAISMIRMETQTDFKVNGTINLSVDKNVNSPLTSPIVAMSSDSIATSPLEYVLAATASDSPYTSGTASTTAEPTVGTSQTDTQNPYKSVINSIKQISGTFSGSIGHDGNSMDITIKRSVGSDKISLKNTNSKLWVQSDNIKFNDKAEKGKWLQYNLGLPKGQTIAQSTFQTSSIEGFSVKGSRVANEKIGNVRCYNYELDQIEVGNLLTKVGVKSDMIQSAGGNVWIGVKDKLIHKISLKVTPATSYSTSSLEISVEFSDFGTSNNFTVPATSLITKTTDEAVSSASNTESSSTTTSSTTGTVYTRDLARKNDLSSLKTALLAYFAAHRTYPVVSNYTAITATSLAGKAIVPTYLTTIPAEPNASSGWWYGYKSDGKSFILSARLENTLDTAGQDVGGVYLYLLNN